jgi:uncharacterized membrane protein
MGKLDYLNALKRAMLGLPPEIQARTLAAYEQRFVDGEAAGRDELDVGRELDDPNQVALALRTSAHLQSLNAAAAAPPPAPPKTFDVKGTTGTRNPARMLRMLVSGAGLTVFNLFMIVPALVVSALLAAVYVCALAFYLAGIATTASGLAGTNELVLDWPTRFIDVSADDGRPRQLRIDIGERGINVHPGRAPGPAADDDGDRPDSAADDGSGAYDDSGDSRDSRDERERERERRAHSRVLRGAEAVADSTVRISTGMDAGSRSAQTAFGFAMVLGGIALCLLALTVTRYTLVGFKRYLNMNWSLLRGQGG